MQTIFSSANIYLPNYEKNDSKWETWATIACDQFTSEISYWEKVDKITENQLSTYHLFLPEAYLETEKEKGAKERIRCAMDQVKSSLQLHSDIFVYLERTLPSGEIRRGVVGKIDLEAYDYSSTSKSPVRATEKTVVERIPPRAAIRREAPLELPHIMILIDDPDKRMIPFLSQEKDNLSCLYDFNLMQGGGHVKGYEVTGNYKEQFEKAIAEYEKEHAGKVVYAMGDGNHSLAAAKAHYEKIKEQFGEKALSHPARFALCEIVALQEESLVFEPIYRVMKKCNAKELLKALSEVTVPGKGEQTITIVTKSGEQQVHFKTPAHALTVGSLQIFLDEYMKNHGEVICDYIHDEASLRTLACEENSVGFLFEGMSKEELFPYVTSFGTLPRKTFSMGEARSKRYYLEVRSIQ